MRWRWVLTWLVCAVVTIGLVALWARAVPEDAASASSVVAAVVGLFGVMAMWAWRRNPRHGAASTPVQVTDAARILARLVRRQWRNEAALRQLFDPAPLPVVWEDCPLRRVTDHRQLIGDPVTCRADQADELAATFRGLPRRRLVVLGPAGSGKTTFAVLLTLALLRDREADEPVPVLLSLASFDPSHETVETWLRRRILADYPQVADTDTFGPSAVVDLLADGLVLPVLDALDECPETGRAAVLRALNDTLDPHTPLVLTCRTDDYAAAVADADVLVGAAVVSPAPVRPDDAIALLRLATPPGPRQEPWDALVEHLAREPEGAAAKALASPLTVALARAVYADAPGDPAELGDPRRFPTAEAVEHHLLDALVPTLFARAHRTGPAGWHRWDPHRARRYLTFLARGLEARGTYELAWWQLYHWVPALARPWRRAAVWGGVTAVAMPLWLGSFYVLLLTAADAQWAPAEALMWLPTTVVSVVCMQCVASWIAERPSGAIPPTTALVLIGLGGGLAASSPFFFVELSRGSGAWNALGTAATFAGLYGFPALMALLSSGLPQPPGQPQRGALALRHWRQRLPAAAVTVLAVTLFGGVTLAALAGGSFFESDSVTAWVHGMAFGAGTGAAQAVLGWVRSTTSPGEFTTPKTSLRADRLIAVVNGVTGVVLTGVPIVALNSGTGVQPYLIWQLLIGVAALGLTGGALTLSAYAWPYYCAARTVFAVRGRLPWRLQTFLADAHRLGVLRQVGPVYQFRHARLQHRLAGVRVPAARTAPGRADAPARGRAS
ncbi:NACHT domain-containing protein [Streptomyces sp. NPDC020412]|uniref:NACHT domain-containing protein n=1 Tax=Streptomyces sp. NPDC020412 TaxID=3365073 RepID=UPI0037BAFC6B